MITVLSCVLYISTSIWVLRTPNAGQNSFMLKDWIKDTFTAHSLLYQTEH